jgi:CBS domain-containing protein
MAQHKTTEVPTIDENPMVVLEEAGKSGDRLERHIIEDPLYKLPLQMVVAVTPDTTIGTCLEKLAMRGRGTALVIEEGKLIGIFGERDVLMKQALRDDDWRSEPVSQHMVKEPVTLPPDASIAFALNRMNEGDYRHIPVVNEFGFPVGVVSIKDIVAYIQHLIS